MELEELIAAVKAAKDKAELEALVKTELELDLDKRKSLDTLRAEVLKGLGVIEGDEPSPGEGGAGDGNASGASAAAGNSLAEGDGDGDGDGDVRDAELQRLLEENAELRDSLDAEHEQILMLKGEIADLQASRQVVLAGQVGHATGSGLLTPPTLGDDEEQAAAPDTSGVRLLRNTENGRDFAWSPELAKLPHMKEL